MWKGVVTLLLGLVAVPALGGLLLPWPGDLRWREPASTSFMDYRIREARARGDSLPILHEFVPLEQLPSSVRRAVLVAEDHRFLEHRGIDWEALREETRYRGNVPVAWGDPGDRGALLEALRYYRDHRDRIRGRSTITQQLAKNLYYTPERSLLRKVKELVVARRLEYLLDKDRILELYLSYAELGPGIFGFAAAARAYFDRPPGEIDLAQAAALAGTLPHPLTSNPARAPGRMAWRRELILERLRPGAPPGGIQAPPPVDEPEVVIPLPDLSEPVLPYPPAPDTVPPP